MRRHGMNFDKSDIDTSTLVRGDVAVSTGQIIKLDTVTLDIREIPEMDLRELYRAQDELKTVMVEQPGNNTQWLGAALSMVNAELMSRGTVLHFGESLDE